MIYQKLGNVFGISNIKYQLQKVGLFVKVFKYKKLLHVCLVYYLNNYFRGFVTTLLFMLH